MKTPPRPRSSKGGPPTPRRPQASGISADLYPSEVMRDFHGGGASEWVADDSEYSSVRKAAPEAERHSFWARRGARKGARKETQTEESSQESGEFPVPGSGRGRAASSKNEPAGESQRRNIHRRTVSRKASTTRPPRTPHEGLRQVPGSAPHRRSRTVVAKTPTDALRTLRTPTGQHDAVEVLGSKEQGNERTAAIERIDERIRARRRGWLFYSLSGFAAVFVVSALTWVVFFSALFALDATRITVNGGDERFTNDAAQQVIASHAGTPITRLSMQSLAEELDGVPQVKEAQVSRVWPAGIDVKLTMRVPVMAEKTPDGYVLLDDEAVALATEGQAPESLAVVTLPRDEAQRTAAVQSVATVRRALPEQLQVEVAQWNVENHQIHFTFKDGRSVNWGTPDDSELKGKVLALLVGQRNAQFYDVSSPTSPVTSSTDTTRLGKSH